MLHNSNRLHICSPFFPKFDLFLNLKTLHEGSICVRFYFNTFSKFSLSEIIKALKRKSWWIRDCFVLEGMLESGKDKLHLYKFANKPSNLDINLKAEVWMVLDDWSH